MSMAPARTSITLVEKCPSPCCWRFWEPHSTRLQNCKIYVNVSVMSNVHVEALGIQHPRCQLSIMPKAGGSKNGSEHRVLLLCACGKAAGDLRRSKRPHVSQLKPACTAWITFFESDKLCLEGLDRRPDGAWEPSQSATGHLVQATGERTNAVMFERQTSIFQPLKCSHWSNRMRFWKQMKQECLCTQTGSTFALWNGKKNRFD